MTGSLANFTRRNVDQLATIVKSCLRTSDTADHYFMAS